MAGSSAAAVTAAALTAAVRDAHHWYTAQAARNPTYTAGLTAPGANRQPGPGCRHRMGTQ